MYLTYSMAWLELLALVTPVLLWYNPIADDFARYDEATAIIAEQIKFEQEQQRIEEQKQNDLNETFTEWFITRLNSLNNVKYRLWRFDEEANAFDCVWQKPIKKYAQKEQQDLVNYAREVSNCNKDFILTIERESWFRWDAVWDWWTSYWLCQWHVPWQKDWRTKSNDPAIQNWYNMIDKCRWSWQKKQESWWVGNWLYWYRVRHTVEKRFAFHE